MIFNRQDFAKYINDLRKENKNKWYFFEGQVENKQVQIKGFNTSLQSFRINGIWFPNPQDISVKEFTNNILKAFDYEF